MLTHSSYRLIAVPVCLLLYVLTTDASQNTASSSDKTIVSVSQDPGSWRRDPFIGGIKKGVTLNKAKVVPVKKTVDFYKQNTDQWGIELQGIIQTEKTFHALINGRTVKIGDTIAGVTIKEISRFKVVLLNERKEKIIYDIYQGRMD